MLSLALEKEEKHIVTLGRDDDEYVTYFVTEQAALVCRWVFFPPSDMPYLYPQFPNSMDPVFEADLTSPNLEKQPLLHLTHPTECILTEGLCKMIVNKVS